MASVFATVLVAALVVVTQPARIDVVNRSEPQLVVDPAEVGPPVVKYAELRVVRSLRADYERTDEEFTQYIFSKPRNVILTLSCDIVTVDEEGTSRIEREVVVPLVLEMRKHYVVQPIADLLKGTCDVDVNEERP